MTWQQHPLSGVSDMQVASFADCQMLEISATCSEWLLWLDTSYFQNTLVLTGLTGPKFGGFQNNSFVFSSFLDSVIDGKH